MLAGTSQEACRLFVGTRGADTITFVCLRAGGYSILCNGASIGSWGPDDLDACVSAYLAMVERPARQHQGIHQGGSDAGPAARVPGDEPPAEPEDPSPAPA